MVIHTYQIGSDDEVIFTRRLVSKLPTVPSIPDDAAQINLNTNDKELRAQIEEVYGQILKYYNVYIDSEETVYFEPTHRRQIIYR